MQYLFENVTENTFELNRTKLIKGCTSGKTNKTSQALFSMSLSKKEGYTNLSPQETLLHMLNTHSHVTPDYYDQSKISKENNTAQSALKYVFTFKA